MIVLDFVVNLALHFVVFVKMMEVSTILFGNEDKPDARFVYLEDCEHCIESEGLDQWINQNSEEIAMKQCPLCKMPILKTQRFMNQVKMILNDISKVKSKQYGELSVISSHMKKMLNSLKSLNTEFNTFIGNVNKYYHVKRLWNKFCCPLLNFSGQANCHLPASNIESLEFVVELFQCSSKYKNRIENIKNHKMKGKIVDHFVWLLSVAFTYPHKLSNQQKSDIKMEMIRGAKILDLFEIISNLQYRKQITDLKELRNFLYNMKIILMSCQPYNLDKDKEIEHFAELIKKKNCDLVVITEEEKIIKNAMSKNFIRGSNAHGRWFKCSNGHIYCVTECGSLVVKSVCPKCKVKIGRTAGRTLLATEMLNND